MRSMTIKPRTIDNLGVEASKRYAQDQKLVDKDLLSSKNLPPRTDITTMRPYVGNEYVTLFESGRTVSWAHFAMPPQFMTSARRLFTYLLVPSLGSIEKLQADADKLESLKDALSEDPEGEKKRKALWELYQLLLSLNRMLGTMNARRNQYQKG